MDLQRQFDELDEVIRDALLVQCDRLHRQGYLDEISLLRNYTKKWLREDTTINLLMVSQVVYRHYALRYASLRQINLS